MARVIKSGEDHAVGTVGRAAALNIANFAEQAQKLIIEAQTKASQIIASATTKARELQAEAEKRGYEQGFAKGLAEGEAAGAEKAFQQTVANFQKQTADLQQMLRKCVLQLEQNRNDILQQARSEVLELALAIAEKVTHVQAQEHIEVAKASLGKAIEMLNCSGPVQLKCAPSQLNQLSEYAGQFLAEMGMNQTVKLAADESLSPGDVILVSRNGQVDARIQTQIDNIISALTGSARRDSADDAGESSKAPELPGADASATRDETK